MICLIWYNLGTHDRMGEPSQIDNSVPSSRGPYDNMKGSDGNETFVHNQHLDCHCDVSLTPDDWMVQRNVIHSLDYFHERHHHLDYRHIVWTDQTDSILGP